MLNRKNCPHCDKKLPLLLFTANRKLGVLGDSVFFQCPKCAEVIEARSSEAHQKNFLWIFLVPLFATPLIFSLKSMVGSRYLAFYFLFTYGLSLMIPTIIGQHRMDFFASSKEAFEKLELEARAQKEQQ
jgi:predicted RNA-binding Zn-ribbon protein involved in translation (DUF1610 family)